MKSRNFYVLGLPALLVGVILIITYRNISSSGVIITGGILFILVGLLNLIFFRSHGTRESSHSVIATVASRVSSAGAIILGLALLLFNETFASLVPFIFAILIALLAIDQFYILAISETRKVLSPWFLIAPLALLGTALYIFLGDAQSRPDETVMLCTGIAAAFFGLISVVEALIVSARTPAAPVSEAETGDTPAPAAAPKTPAAAPKALDASDENK